MRCFISAVALLVKVTARMFWYSIGLIMSKEMYSTAKVNVFPEPAEALYILKGCMIDDSLNVIQTCWRN